MHHTSSNEKILKSMFKIPKKIGCDRLISSDNNRICENGMLILDCTSEPQENMSEGLLIKELVRILEPEISPRVVKVRGVSAFKRELRDSSERLVHISANTGKTKGKTDANGIFSLLGWQ